MDDRGGREGRAYHRQHGHFVFLLSLRFYFLFLQCAKTVEQAVEQRRRCEVSVYTPSPGRCSLSVLSTRVCFIYACRLTHVSRTPNDRVHGQQSTNDSSPLSEGSALQQHSTPTATARASAAATVTATRSSQTSNLRDTMLQRQLPKTARLQQHHRRHQQRYQPQKTRPQVKDKIDHLQQPRWRPRQRPRQRRKRRQRPISPPGRRYCCRWETSSLSRLRAAAARS